MEKKKIKLSKPLVCLDLETTSADTNSARIIQFSAVKLFPGGEKETIDLLINPGILIPKEATEIHGITNDNVNFCPLFHEVAQQIEIFIGDADIAGYNSIKFDIPVLIEEFARLGIKFDVSFRKLLDIFRIYQKLRPRTLTACYLDITGKEMVNAHDALADTVATLEILETMVSNGQLPSDVEQCEAFGIDRESMVDFAGNFIKKDGHYYYNFGKNKGRAVNSDMSYLSWMLNGTFSSDTKNWCNYFITKKQQQQNFADDDLPF